MRGRAASRTGVPYRALEIGLQTQAAAKEITRNDGIPFAAYVSDPCDGRSQGTHGMFDSLPYRNDAAMVFRRLIRLYRRVAVIGVLPATVGYQRP